MQQQNITQLKDEMRRALHRRSVLMRAVQVQAPSSLVAYALRLLRQSTNRLRRMRRRANLVTEFPKLNDKVAIVLLLCDMEARHAAKLLKRVH